MKTFLLACGMLTAALCAGASQLALIVLNMANWTAGKPPSDWQVKVTHGKPDISVCPDGDGSCLRLKSVKASFGLERGVDVDAGQMPFLSWRWKVSQLPAGGDVRHSGTDDQAAQVLVAFADKKVVSYIWDTSAPKGLEQNASFIPLVHVYAVVCQSGAANLNRWITETHNVAADYERAYGRPAPHVKGVRIQINSQHTGTTAESCFGDVAFRSTAQ